MTSEEFENLEFKTRRGNIIEIGHSIDDRDELIFHTTSSMFWLNRQEIIVIRDHLNKVLENDK